MVQLKPAMPSIRHHLIVALLRLTRRKRVYATVEGMYAGVAQVRRAGPARPSQRIQKRVQVTRHNDGPHEVYTLRPRAPSAQAPHLLYLHGGAYIRPITPFHWDLLADLVERTGCVATVPLYPLAPEHACEQTLEMVLRVHSLLRAEARPSRLTIAGDSAGGGLALALALALRDRDLPQVDHLALITPWVDVALTHPLIATTAPTDPMLALPGAQEAGRLYAGPWPVHHPYVSPLHAELHGLPPTTLLIGTRDILCHDAQALADKLAAQGSPLRTHMGEGMIHVWPLLPIAEARSARAVLAQAISPGAQNTGLR